jgi:nicotinamidase-related amidase
MELLKPVLMVIDVQNGFLNAHSLTVVPNICRVIEACSRSGVPILFTAFMNTIGSPFERLIGWNKVRNPPETDLHESVRPFADILITKNFYTAFTSELDELVKKYGWTTILICGVATESCVLKTAVDAFERQLTPIVIADSCASDLGTEMHSMGLAVIEVLIGKDQIVSTDEVVTKLAK